LLYSTYLGGSNDDVANAIAVNNAGNAYVTGFTWSSDFPTRNAYQPSLGGANDAYVTELSADGRSLVYSTYLGGGAYDGAQAIALDSSGIAYVAGTTIWDNLYGNFPVTQGALQTTFAGGDSTNASDGFVSKLSADGKTLMYSTFLGGQR
jgi:hypothetical protein